MKKSKNEDKSNGFECFMIALSIAIVFIALCFISTTGVKTTGADIKALKLNELGDYLAGVFSPIVFFWLIYGYFMQRKELEYQREELTAQKEEFSRFANNSEYQSDIERSQLQPDFNAIEPKPHPSREDAVTLILGITKSTLFEVEAKSSPKNKISAVDVDSKGNIKVLIARDAFGDRLKVNSFDQELKIHLSFTDISGYKTFCEFKRVPYKSQAVDKKGNDQPLLRVRKAGILRLTSIKYSREKGEMIFTN